MEREWHVAIDLIKVFQKHTTEPPSTLNTSTNRDEAEVILELETVMGFLSVPV